MQCFPMGYSKVTVSNRRQAKQEVPEEKERESNDDINAASLYYYHI